MISTTSLKRLALTATVAVTMGCTALAGDIFWSGDGSTAGGAGTWDTTTAHWGAASGGTYPTTWNNTTNAGDMAQFDGTGGSVVIQAGGITTGGLEIDSTGYSFSAGMLSIGSQGIDCDASSGPTTFNGPLNLTANQNWYSYSANVIDVAGDISGTGKITQAGGGPTATIILRGDNSSWSGGIATSKPIQLGHDNALGTGAFTMGDGEVSAINGAHIFSAPLYKNITNSDVVLAFGGTNGMEFTGTFTIDAGINPHYADFLVTNTADTEFSGDIVQAVGDTFARSVIKTGSGTLIFSGDNTYWGTTAVNVGTLIVNGTTSGQDSYSVAAGATLKGSGTIGLIGGASLSTVTGSTLAPGESVGTLDVNGTVNLGGILEIEVENGAADALAVLGALNLGGTLTILDLGGNSPNTTFDILSASSIIGDFAAFNLPDGMVIVDNGNADGTYTLATVPEPVSATLLAMTTLLALRRRTRR